MNYRQHLLRSFIVGLLVSGLVLKFLGGQVYGQDKLTMAAVRQEKLEIIAKPKIFNVRSYGAVGDGVAMETEAIQKTIDACHAAGGGVVWVPAGDFVIGTVHLKSHITLSLDYGASLLGSQNQADYPTDKLRRARRVNLNACSTLRTRPISGLKVLA